MLNNYSYLSKVILAIQTVGNVFLCITSFGATVKRFVYGVFPDDEVQESDLLYLERRLKVYCIYALRWRKVRLRP